MNQKTVNRINAALMAAAILGAVFPLVFAPVFRPAEPAADFSATVAQKCPGAITDADLVACTGDEEK